MFLDADSTFHARWGGEGSDAVRKRRTAAKMISIVHGANSVISDPVNFGAGFGIIVAGTEIHTDSGWLSQVSANETEGVSSYEAYLGTTLPDARPRKGRAVPHRRTIPANDVCLNFLFIHRDLGDRLGVAILGSIVPGAITGACARQPSVSAGEVLVSNVGMITTLHNGTTVSASSSLHTFVHEFGHSFGAIHTCCRPENPNCEAGVPCRGNATEATECHPVGRKYGNFEIVLGGPRASLFAKIPRRAAWCPWRDGVPNPVPRASWMLICALQSDGVPDPLLR